MALLADKQTAVLAKIKKNRRLAHQVLFAHRHAYATPEFHGEIIDDMHSDAPFVCDIAFRGAAKSTIGEEAVVIRGGLREFKLGLVVGVSLPKAAERLHSIRRQFERNEQVRVAFGDLKSSPWGDDKIELANGTTIQAMGRGQAIRGTKAEDVRPDFMLLDDIDDYESIRSPELREKIMGWFLSELLPSGDGPNLKVRMLANDLGLDCIANRLRIDPRSGFKVHVYPCEYVNSKGERQPMWPSRFPLSEIDKVKARYFALGRGADYNREYMCRSDAPEDKPFKADMIRVEPRPRTWQAVYAMLDPARTVNTGSATTGCAIWSRIGAKLIVWDGWAKKMLPSEIIQSLFDINQQYSPVKLGVEKDGLEEWMMQPIRQEQVKRGIILPVVGLRAPKGKYDFIRGLQQFFSAREVEFAKECPELKQQLLSFPAPPIDAPNALAYCLILQPGAPMYEDFSGQNVAEEIEPASGRPLYVCFNTNGRHVTAQLVQYFDGALRVYADWLREGEPDAILGDLVREIGLSTRRGFKAICPPTHFDRWNNFGMVQAANRIPLAMNSGQQADLGRSEMRALLRTQARGFPALMVSSAARWTLNGLAGGYCRAVHKHGALAEYAEEGQYRVLIEGLESFVGLSGSGLAEQGEGYFRTAADGTRYRSALRR